ncbi:MAG: hypothetical protein SFV18_15460 [Bryobacteraceae bacterium]|nr:hypothetical protein [Bryobacteraceae bacterium]
MIQRVMPGLMNLKNIVVFNDEAHHCYRERPPREDEEPAIKLAAGEKEEAEHNKETARLWMSGLEAANRQLGIARVVDPSWTLSDFLAYGCDRVRHR